MLQRDAVTALVPYLEEQKCGVACYWRLDLQTRRLEVRTGPTADGAYRTVRILDEADEVEVPETALRWHVRDLLPAPL